MLVYLLVVCMMVVILRPSGLVVDVGGLDSCLGCSVVCGFAWVVWWVCYCVCLFWFAVVLLVILCFCLCVNCFYD